MLIGTKPFSDQRICQLNNTVKLQVTTADRNSNFGDNTKFFFRKTRQKINTQFIYEILVYLPSSARNIWLS